MNNKRVVVYELLNQIPTHQLVGDEFEWIKQLAIRRRVNKQTKLTAEDAFNEVAVAIEYEDGSFGGLDILVKKHELELYSLDDAYKIRMAELAGWPIYKLDEGEV